jgi:drug/metabolite transporter (DMT)-like permease
MFSKRTSLFDIFLMITLILLWGSSFVVVKIALQEGLTPISIATFRFLIAGGLFFLIVLFGRTGKNDSSKVKSLTKKEIPLILSLALSGITIFFVAQYTGIKMAGAAIAAIFVCLLSPILISIFSAIILKEHIKKIQIAGIIAATCGTFIVISGGSLSFGSSPDFFTGSLILLSTPFLWTCYTLLGKKVVEKYDLTLIVAYTTILGGLLLIPMSILENSFHLILSLSINGWLAISFLSITCSLLGSYIWFYVLEHVGPTITSSFLFVEPLVTAFLERT